jgi:hypothetical protein
VLGAFQPTLEDGLTKIAVHASLSRAGKAVGAGDISILDASWYTETSVDEKFVKSQHVVGRSSVGEYLEVMDIKNRTSGFASVVINEQIRDSKHNIWIPAQVVKVAVLTSPIDELANIMLGIAREDLNNPETERQIFVDGNPAVIRDLREKSVQAATEHDLICYNWPKLSEVAIQTWRTEPRFRTRLHHVIYDFLMGNFYLKELATVRRCNILSSHAYQLIQIHTYTDYCLLSFCTWVLTTRNGKTTVCSSKRLMSVPKISIRTARWNTCSSSGTTRRWR